MPSFKISTKDMRTPIAEKLETVNIKTFTSLEQIGLSAGKETFASIMEALPENSILQLAVTSNNNTEIYPNSVGNLIIEDIYSTGATFRFYSKVGNIVRIWKGLYDGNEFSGWARVYSELDPPKASDIEGAVTADYVDQQIALVTGTGIPKLQVYAQDLIIGTEGQTEFPITLNTFDPATDTVMVQTGMLLLNPNGDYVVEGNKVILNEAVSEGQTVGIWVWKHVPTGEEGSVSGSVIGPNSMPVDRLTGKVSVQNGGWFVDEETTADDKTAALEGLAELGVATSTELDNVKKSVSDGKAAVANAITTKGISTAVDATFETMATNISNIVTLDSAPGLEAKTWTPGTSNQVIAAGNYLRGDQTIAGDANLVAGNIAKGKSIFGITGTYDPTTTLSLKSKRIEFTKLGPKGTGSDVLSVTIPGRIVMVFGPTSDTNAYGTIKYEGDQTRYLWFVGYSLGKVAQSTSIAASTAMSIDVVVSSTNNLKWTISCDSSKRVLTAQYTGKELGSTTISTTAGFIVYYLA